MSKLLVLSLLTLGIALLTTPVRADAVLPGAAATQAVKPVCRKHTALPGYKLELTLRSPVWSSQTGTVNDWRTTEFGGRITLNNVIPGAPQIHPFLSGMHAMGNWNNIFDAQNCLQAGFDYDLGHNLTFTSYYDRHFTRDIDRVFVGLKYSTGGLF